MSEAYKLSTLSVDRTFNFGKFEVSPFTYRHSNIRCKSKNVPEKWVSATIIGPILIQSNKKQESYVTGFQAVANKCTLEKEELSITADGEQVLIDSCKISFRKCNQYRCMKHFKSNCEEVLNKIGILSSQQGLMLDVVFGETETIESENKKELSGNLEIACRVLDAYEKICKVTTVKRSLLIYKNMRKLF